MLRLFALVAIPLLALTTAAPANAESVSCKSEHLNDGRGGPDVHRLRAVNQPGRTDFQASPCLVAEAAAREIRGRLGDRLPRRIEVHGMNWDGGFYRCRYSRRAAHARSFTAVSCRRIDKPRRRVTMWLAMTPP